MKKWLSLLAIPLLLTALPFIAYAQAQKDISVSAVIPPNASDYQFDLASDGQPSAAQNTVLTYHITYGAQTSAGLDTPTTIVAHFSDDLAPGGSDVLDYVIGSATNAYGGTIPIVDLTNRTITWSMASLPAGTINQSVTFQLRTNENYTGASPVTFTTRANMSNQYVTMPDSSVSQTYQFDQSLVTPTPTMTPTPTPTGLPTSTPTAAPGPTATPAPATVTPIMTPTPTEKHSTLRITGITFTNISTNEATVAVATNQPAKAFISYGTSATNLNQRTSTSPFGVYNTLSLTHLLPATAYYLQVVITTPDGKSHTSEVFTFKTAHQTPVVPSSSEKNAITITSNDFLLSSELLADNENSNTLVVLTTTTAYQLSYTYATLLSITSSEVIVRSPSGQEKIIHLKEQSSLVYNAHLRTDGPGRATILIRTSDKNGNVHEQKIAQLKVIHPLTVLDQSNHSPIADARVLFSIFNPASGKYEILPKDFVPGFKNPGFTDANGELHALLPVGSYQAQVSAWGHRAATVDFTLGGEDGQDFPTVRLQSDFFDLTSLGTFLHDWLWDFWLIILTIFSALSHSPRLFEIAAGTVTGGFILLSYLLFSIRTHMKLFHILPFFFFFIAVARNKHKQAYLSGTISSPAKQPLSGVRIEVLDPKTHNILSHAVTHANGTFYIRNRFDTAVVILLLTKDGFAPEEITIETAMHAPLSLTLQKHEHHTPQALEELEYVAGSLFEVSILFAFVLQLIFFTTFGAIMTLPFLVFSLINVMLWLFYREEQKHL
ncbi:MAG: fibronectin type III domain-containing protein [Candidatus Levyibacteriota bacterium]